MTVRKDPGDDWAPDHMARWLEAVTKRMHADLGAQGGFAFPELRGSHRRLLQMIPPEGIRINDLPRRADMTKEAQVESRVGPGRSVSAAGGGAPADGRVRLITRTEQGDAAA